LEDRDVSDDEDEEDRSNSTKAETKSNWLFMARKMASEIALYVREARISDFEKKKRK